MEINESNLQTLTTCISQTLNPDPNVRKPAEKYLESVETTQNFSLLLLHLVNTQAVDAAVRLAGAIAFKNFVKRNWADDKIHENDRDAIKREIVQLMLKSPDNVQQQLSDAISVIGRHDFPDKWPTLINDMVQKLQTEDFHIINGVLKTAHSLFKRYRFEFKSDRLWREIKLVLENFAAPLTQLFTTLMGMATQHQSNKEAITTIYSSLLLVSKIFYSLNSQEIPEFFEDNLAVWMPHFHTLLVNDIPLLKTGEDEEAGLLEQIRSQICDNVGMYARKYDEEFEQYLPIFVTDIWSLLVSTGNQLKYDMLTSNAIQFLAMVAEKDRNKKLFDNADTMSGICQKVIIPNMEFREADEELFEDNPEEYIRRDVEGSDVDTRRRSACDLVRALSRHFEAQMTGIFGQYVQEMLLRYSQNPATAWKSKDAAIYLVTSIVAKGKTEKQGVTITNTLISVPDFFATHILPELTASDVNSLPVLKADAIKYLMIFRNQLPPETIKGSLQHLLKFLGAESIVVSTYAANCLEKMLLLKQANNTPLIQVDTLSPIGDQLIAGLFTVLSRPGMKENEYVMKAIMRTTSALQEKAAPLMGFMLPKLLEALVTVAKNPSKPHFNHYLFETLCLSIKIMCRQTPAAVDQFEMHLFPIFQSILQQDVAEFIPYVFQIMALMLDTHPPGSKVPEPYLILFPCLLAPPLWEKNANVPPLVRLLQVIIRKGPTEAIIVEKLGALLGVFQKLVASKTNDHEGFSLLQALVLYLSPDAMAQFLQPVIMLLFQRLTSSKTTKFVKCLLVYFSIYIFKYGTQSFIDLIDSVETNFMAKVLDRLWIAETPNVSSKDDKKAVAIGVTKLLCECPQIMLTGRYDMYWPPLLSALIQMLESQEISQIEEESEDHFAEIDQISSYQASYAKLVFGVISIEDPFAGSVTDTKLFLAQNLGKLSAGNPGKIGPLTSGINPAAQTFLANYLAAAGVQLV